MPSYTVGHYVSFMTFLQLSEACQCHQILTDFTKVYRCISASSCRRFHPSCMLSLSILCYLKLYACCKCLFVCEAAFNLGYTNLTSTNSTKSYNMPSKRQRQTHESGASQDTSTVSKPAAAKYITA